MSNKNLKNPEVLCWVFFCSQGISDNTDLIRCHILCSEICAKGDSVNLEDIKELHHQKLKIMANTILPKKEIAFGETTDTMESVLFTKIYEKNIGTSKIKDMLPIMNHLKANSKFDLKGVNKFFYHKDMNQELVRLVTQN